MTTTEEENAARWRAHYPLMHEAMHPAPEHFENPIEHAFQGAEFDPWLDERGQPLLEVDDIDITELVRVFRGGTIRRGLGQIHFDVLADRYISTWTLD